MNAELLQAQKAIQNARDALRSGDRSSARQWAEQAAELAPQLEDPWLILASVASPRASVSFIERALQVNPESPRARKGMQWALKRLQQAPPASGGEVPSAQKTPVRRKPARSGEKKRSAEKNPAEDSLSCIVAGFGLPGGHRRRMDSQHIPGIGIHFEAEHPNRNASSPSASLGAGGDRQTGQELLNRRRSLWHLKSDPTVPPPTPEPAPFVADFNLPCPRQLRNQPPRRHLAPPTATLEPPVPSDSEVDPTVTPEATSTPAGSLVLEIVEDTPVPTRATHQRPRQPQTPPVGNGVRWIEVNLSEQRTYAWEGDVLVNSFIVSTGTWATPTVVGTFQIWNKTRIQTMSGPGYSLPNVPWVMYFYKDYGFHGTYWHNNFGTPMSHGCVNLTMADSEWLYNWASYGTTVKVHY